MSKKPSKRRRSAEPSRPVPSADAPALTLKSKRRLAEEQRRQQQRRRWLQIAVIAGLAIAIGLILAIKFGVAPAAVPLEAAVLHPAGPEVPAGTAEEQLDQLLAAGQPVFAFFHSYNCAQCTRMIAIVDQVYPEFAGSVALVDVDVYDAQNRRLLQREQIRLIPTQVFYNRAGQAQTITGVMQPEQLRQQLRAIGGGP